MSVLRKCQIAEWKPKALKFAKSLKGRDNTPAEAEFLSKHPDHWDFFYVFGSDETRQGYINATIKQIESCDDIPNQIICELRLKWSAERLKGIPQK